MNLTKTFEKFTNWERFQSLASELISPKIEIRSRQEPCKASHDFVASIASAYRLSTIKITISDINNDIPVLDRLLKYKQRLRKLLQEIWNPTCKTAFNRFTKSVSELPEKRHLKGGTQR
jgi:hypothetical protein